VPKLIFHLIEAEVREDETGDEAVEVRLEEVPGRLRLYAVRIYEKAVNLPTTKANTHQDVKYWKMA
jgi:hypothetical protein